MKDTYVDGEKLARNGQKTATYYAASFLSILASVKAELSQVGILFGTQFPSLGIFISKKVGF